MRNQEEGGREGDAGGREREQGGSDSETRREASWKINLSVPTAHLLTLAVASLTILRKPQAWTWAFSGHGSLPK